MSWSVACSFLYLATQLPTSLGHKVVGLATSAMVRSVTGHFAHAPCLAAPLSTSPLAWSPPMSTHGKKISPSPRNARHSTPCAIRVVPHVLQAVPEARFRFGILAVPSPGLLLRRCTWRRSEI